MLNIGSKIYRNLQEQVGFNTESIEKIVEYLDGMSLDDKLIVIPSTSGTLTDEEYDVASKKLSFMATSSAVYIKTEESASEIVFRQAKVVADEISGTYFEIGTAKIVVSKLTKAYVGSIESILAVYSKTQMDSLLSGKADLSYVNGQLVLKANLSGADFTGNISAPQIKQLNPNLEVDISRWEPAIVGTTVETIYSKMFVEANLDMHIVVCLKISNPTESSVSSSGRLAYTKPNYLTPSSDLIASGYGAKIYDFSGHNLAEVLPNSAVSIVRIATAKCFKVASTPRPTVYDANVSFQHATSSEGQNHFAFDFYQPSTTITIEAGADLYMICEMNLTL